MKKILFPTDFSDQSLNGLNYARHLALKFEADIHVLHVYTPHSGAMGGTGEFLPVVPDESEMIEKLMVNFLGKAKGYGVATLEKIRIESEIITGFPGDEINRYAEEIGADLVIMGTRNEHNFADKLLGSVSTSTIRKGKCPVLLIPENALFRGIDNILYATSFEKAEFKVLKESLHLARLLKADLHYVHVDEGISQLGYHEVDTISERLMAKKNNQSLSLKMAKVKSATLEKGLDQYIEKHDIDLLVMLSAQKNLFEQLFLVSNTCKMAFHTRVPLLVMR